MSKPRRVAIVFVAFLTAAAVPATAMEVDINFLLGVKAIDGENTWQNDRQAAFAVETTFGKSAWPVKIALDALGSAAEQDPLGASLTRGTGEFDFGVRKIWNLGKTRPFVGGGIGFLSGFQEVLVVSRVVDDQDSTLGLWVNGGAFWRLGRRFNIGVDLRLSSGKVTLFGDDVEVGGTTFGLLLGWGWGGAAGSP